MHTDFYNLKYLYPKQGQKVSPTTKNRKCLDYIFHLDKQKLRIVFSKQSAVWEPLKHHVLMILYTAEAEQPAAQT